LDKTAYYSVKYSCPEWLAEFWIEYYGESAAEGIMAASIGGRPVHIRVNTRRTAPEELIESLASEGVSARRSPHLPEALELESLGRPERLDSFRSGLFHVQDLSSQFCVAALGPEPGDTVLDLCAAPGGKSFTAAEMTGGSGRVVACDVRESRLGLVAEGAARLGLENIETVRNDASMHNPDLPRADRVLCDVPCSGLGIIGRKPEIRYKSRESLDMLPDLQYLILKEGAKYAKNGARLVYSTCTLSPWENEGVIRRFLAENSGFAPAPLFKKSNLFGNADRDAHFFTFLPHIYGTDGFFIAAFEKIKNDE